MAISKVAVSDVNPISTVTIADNNQISVVTVGIQGPAGPNSILGRDVSGSTAGSSDNGAGLIYDSAN